MDEKKWIEWFSIKKIYIFAPSLEKDIKVLTRGVIGNTSGFGPEESRFEPRRVNWKRIQKDSKACKSIDLQAFLIFTQSIQIK